MRFLDNVKRSVASKVLLSLFCVQVFAASPIPQIDDRCEHQKLYLAFGENVLAACNVETETCIEVRMSEHAESRDQAGKYCWKRPLSIDPDFVGPCPLHMEEIESNENIADESHLQRIYLRNHFNRLNEFGGEVDVFKRTESIEIVQRILASNPENPIALRLLSWLSLFTHDRVNKLDLRLKIHALDSDCPENRWLFLRGFFGSLSAISDNWLTGEGSGAELTKEEIRDLFLRVQNRILEAYDLAIEQNEGAQKITWALESTYNAILTREFENFQKVASLVDIGLEDYVASRRQGLIRRFSNEYDVDSERGRSQSLTFSCSSHALQLGLLEHCVKLLRHFGTADSNLFDSPASDWTRASISLLVGLTSDCSKHADFLLDGPSWWNKQGQCLKDHHTELVSIIVELLERFPEFGVSADREVLEAYLQLDETSDERFLRALTFDDSMIVYASRLIKRLHRMGKVQTATNILMAIEVKKADRLDLSEERLLDNVTNSVREGKYKNWSESSWRFLPDAYSRTESP